METEKASRRKLLIAMLIWGSIGVFCRHVSLSSSVIALARAALGFLSLRVYRLLRKEKTDWTAVRQSLRSCAEARPLTHPCSRSETLPGSGCSVLCCVTA